ncbi:MAG: CHAP domain-containing protein [Candidatus Dormibacteraeota bacterium]|nr:CHAP domain-containing protein [Candidatus Dormibacteraeota bacterium]
MKSPLKRLPIVLALTALMPLAPTPAAASTPARDTAPMTLAQAQDQLNKLDDQVERARASLDAYNRQLTADQARAAALHKQLQAVARLQYERPALSITMILNAQSLSQLLSSVSQARLVAEKQQSLLAQAQKLQQQDQVARDQTQAQLAQIQTSRDQATKLVANLEAQAAAANQAAAGVVAAAKAIGTQSSTGPFPNHFDPGQCTWYVANKRYVPWFGNAGQWIAGAEQYGFPVGSTPQVGAIMVTAESGYGHVSYVESVNPDGSWTVSEMNYTAPFVIDTRTLRMGQVPLIYPGFIYGQ